jgi:hypothetical protein
MTTTNPTTVVRPWPAPFLDDLTTWVPDTAGHLDRLYQLLDAVELDRQALRRALDDYNHHLDRHLHSAALDIAMETC